MRCSATGCRSNYAGEPYTPVFKLPRGPHELVQQSLNGLCREGVEDLKNILVCAKHFSDVDIEATYSMAQADGTFKTQDREVPKLRKESVLKFLQISVKLSHQQLISNATNQLRISLSILEEEDDFDSTSTPTVSESTNMCKEIFYLIYNSSSTN